MNEKSEKRNNFIYKFLFGTKITVFLSASSSSLLFSYPKTCLMCDAIFFLCAQKTKNTNEKSWAIKFTCWLALVMYLCWLGVPTTFDFPLTPSCHMCDETRSWKTHILHETLSICTSETSLYFRQRNESNENSVKTMLISEHGNVI